MAKHSIEVADYDAARGVVVLTEEGGDIVVRLRSDGVEIEANPAGLRGSMVSRSCRSRRTYRRAHPHGSGPLPTD